MNYRIYTDSEKSFDAEHLVNEDSYLFTEFSFMEDRKIRLLLVADGMGGLSDGEQASRNAIEGFMDVFYLRLMKKYLNADMQQYSLNYAVRDVKKILMEAIQNANELVCKRADTYKQTGTTLTAICIMDDYVVVGNVGDSPVYFFRKKTRKLKRISELQTKAEQDVKAGAYKLYSEEYYQNEHILTCSLGQYRKLSEDDIYVAAFGKLEKGDILLAGTDGCFGYTKEAVIQSMLVDCSREEEGFVLTQLFELSRADKYDDQTGLMYVVD